MIESIHQSMVNTWLRCGIQFERRYINGEIIPPGVAARRGSSAHKAAELDTKSIIEKGSGIPLDSLKDATRDEYMRLIKEEGVFIPMSQQSEKNTLLNDNLNKALAGIEKYHEAISPNLKPVAAELKVTVDIGLSLPIVGAMDCIEAGKIRDLKIRDRAKGQEYADTELQPDFYYELYKAHFGEYPEVFIYDEIVPLKTKTNYEPISTKRDKASAARWRHYLDAFIRDLNTGIFRPADPGSWMCSPSWCGYFPSCAFGGLHRIAA